MCCHQEKFSSICMTSSSCSFRITRTAEDLAQTITALSQRLVKLEQRLELIEMQSSQDLQDPSEEEVAILDGVEKLMRECQELLETSDNGNPIDEQWEDSESNIAA